MDCLMGIVKDKTKLYVTHQVEFLPAADLIRVMQNGKIAQAGRFDELLHQNIGFEVGVGAHNQALESILSAEYSSRAFQPNKTDAENITSTSSQSRECTMHIIGLHLLFFVYITLSVGSALCILVRAMLVSVVGLLTSQKLFKDMLHCIIHAPMSFFDSTPTGRIFNRASTDQSVLDLELPGKPGRCAFSMIMIVGTISIMAQVAWPVFVLFVPVTAMCI